MTGIHQGPIPFADMDTVFSTVHNSNLSATHKITRSATFVIAANDSSQASKDQADYVCDGTNDEVEIQAAITSLPDVGGKIYFHEGNYLKGNAAGITLPSNTELELSNAAIIKLANGINANACIFTNSDSTNGNSNIIITGGTLEGNEENQTTGSMYGLNFTKVSNSKIDCWIKGFRSYDAELNACNIILENRCFGSKWNKTKIVYDDFATLSSGSLTITLSPPEDLRYKKVTFLSNFYFTEMFLTPTDGDEFSAKAITALSDPIIAHPYAAATFMKLEIAPYFITENVNDAKYKSVSQIRFRFWNATPYSMGKVALEPLPDRPLVTLNFDDGGDEFHDTFAPILSKYGYRGVVAYQSTYGDTLSKIKILSSAYGWDIISHGETHAHFNDTITNEFAYREYANGRAFLDANGLSKASFMFAAPYNEMTNEKYLIGLDIYEDMRGLSRTNNGVNLKTDWIQNYFTVNADAIFRAKRTHSWEHAQFHKISNPSAVEAFCALVKSKSIDVVTYTDIYGEFRKENWKTSSMYSALGTATITTGQTTVDVTHGLASAPTRVQLTPTTATAGKDPRVTAKETSTFTITIDSAHSADITFDWQAVI